MAQSSKLLSNLGITDFQQYRLYSYDLIDALISVNGIGERRLAKLHDQLAAECDTTHISMSHNWVYRLILNIMQEPITAQNLCEARANGRSLIEQMRDVTKSDVCMVNALLKSTLRPQEQSVIIRVYRDRSHYWSIARQFGCDPARIRQIKSRAMAKLRKPDVAQALQKIIFADNSGDETNHD